VCGGREALALGTSERPPNWRLIVQILTPVSFISAPYSPDFKDRRPRNPVADWRQTKLDELIGSGFAGEGHNQMFRAQEPGRWPTPT
jgi:hypothetical protein